MRKRPHFALGEYLRDTFGREDDHLAGIMPEAVARGMPDIAVSADVGRLLMILTSLTRGRLAVEVGTLAGYSAIWIARGLAPSGRLVTIEKDPAHAEFAREQLRQAGVADRVEVRVGDGIDELKRLGEELAPRSVDVVFLDAAKREYPDDRLLARPLVAPGGLLLADNVCGGGEWAIDETGHPDREGAHALNRLLAQDPEFEAVAVPIRQGILIGRRIP